MGMQSIMTKLVVCCRRHRLAWRRPVAPTRRPATMLSASLCGGAEPRLHHRRPPGHHDGLPTCAQQRHLGLHHWQPCGMPHPQLALRRVERGALARNALWARARATEASRAIGVCACTPSLPPHLDAPHCAPRRAPLRHASQVDGNTTTPLKFAQVDAPRPHATLPRIFPRPRSAQTAPLCTRHGTRSAAAVRMADRQLSSTGRTSRGCPPAPSHRSPKANPPLPDARRHFC